MYSDSDLKIRFLLGGHFDFNGICKLHSLTIRELSEVGFDIYNESISILCITSDDIDELFNYELNEMIEPFDFIFQNCLFGNEIMKNRILNAFELFLKEPVYFSKQGYFFMGKESEERHITKKNYNFLIDVLKQQNCIDIKPKAKPKNEAQKKFFAKLKKAREKYNKKDEGFYHIISAICAKHHSYNLFNIKDLTIYQLIDQYKRIHAIDSYHIGVNSMMHGASGENIKLKHWSESLD